MRRLVVFCVLAVGLALPAAALAIAGGNDDGTLSVRSGVGKVALDFNGSAVGRIVGRGTIKIVDPSPTDGEGFDLWGCDDRFDTGTKTVCSSDGKGLPIRFRAIGGVYRIFANGSGIFLSAVGHGTVILNGAGDDPDVLYDGKFSINDEPYRSLPDYARPYALEAPVGG